MDRPIGENSPNLVTLLRTFRSWKPAIHVIKDRIVIKMLYVINVKCYKNRQYVL
jgi:hypothetical protein